MKTILVLTGKVQGLLKLLVQECRKVVWSWCSRERERAREETVFSLLWELF